MLRTHLDRILGVARKAAHSLRLYDSSFVSYLQTRYVVFYKKIAFVKKNINCEGFLYSNQQQPIKTETITH